MITDLQGIIKTILEEIKQQMDIAIVGMSGGADSTLVALLCCQALGPQRVYSVHMPATSHDEATFNNDSRRVASALGLQQYTVPIAGIAESILGSCRTALGLERLSQVNEGNGRVRARMCVLYTLCHHLGKSLELRSRVVGTGNLSEDFIGYDTKGGDSLADIFPIGELFKSEVYQLLDYFVGEKLILDSMINRTPSAGLWLEQTDENELGYTYAAMEAPIRAYLAGTLSETSSTGDLEPVARFVLERHRAHAHKHLAPSVVRLRHFCK